MAATTTNESFRLREPITIIESQRPPRYQQQDEADISAEGLSTRAPSSSSSSSPDSKTQKLSLILGSAILQIPIWGFAMNYGIFQEHYTAQHRSSPLSSSTISPQTTGIIGTTSNGVMYLSMPLLFALFSPSASSSSVSYRKYIPSRRTASLLGSLLATMSFLLSSLPLNSGPFLVFTQGVLAALGCALVYSPATLSLGEGFSSSSSGGGGGGAGGGGGRALAYGIVLSCKNVVGSVFPFVFRALLSSRLGLQGTLRVWAGVVAVTCAVGVWLIPSPLPPPPPASPSQEQQQQQQQQQTRTTTTTTTTRKSWSFLGYPTFYVYVVAVALQSSGYGIPQTYLSTYAHDVTMVSETTATLLLTLFNVPGIVSSAFFGWLSEEKGGEDGGHGRRSAAATTCISAGSSALAAFLLWGLTYGGGGGASTPLLVLFSLMFGFFAGGYSATWGGVINEIERVAASHDEVIDAGLVYGLLNGARGVGYVSGGLAGVPLLKAGGVVVSSGTGERFGYASSYGSLIVFTGISSALGGLGVICKWGKMMRS